MSLDMRVELLEGKVRQLESLTMMLGGSITKLLEAMQFNSQGTIHTMQLDAINLAAVVMVLTEAGVVDKDKLDAMVVEVTKQVTTAGILVKSPMPEIQPAENIANMLANLAERLKARGHG